MDPHERRSAFQHYQDMLEVKRMKERLNSAHRPIQKFFADMSESTEDASVHSDYEVLEDISPKRSSRIAGFVREHKKAFVGGAVAAVTIVVGEEVIRRIRGK